MRLPLVEDNAANIALFQAVLEGDDHSVIVCTDGGAGQRMPILALSASALPDEIETAMGAGFTAYLTKPIRPQALREAVRNLGGGKERA